LYDNFGEPVSKGSAREHLGLPLNDKIVLFFGFIRKYKGLDILFESMKVLKEKYADGTRIRVLVAGEFYENEAPYLEQIKLLGIADQLILRTQFIADSEVKYYLGAADVVIQPYRNATQSGVTPLAYHFEKPMIVTNVGSLPTLVPHEQVGLVCEPEPDAIAQAIMRFFELGEDFFIPHLRIEKQKYSWEKLTGSIFEVAGLKKV
jgi:glycosyltransferase involved in cell wall biosynthesis